MEGVMEQEPGFPKRGRKGAVEKRWKMQKLETYVLQYN
jgi:hypothetical protein